MSDKTLRFHAHCGLTEMKTAEEMTPAEHASCTDAGVQSRWDPKRKAEVWSIRCDEDFDATATYDTHMAGHSGRPRFTVPRTKIKLRPMVPRASKPAPWLNKPGVTRTCTTCGLVAEVAATNEFDRWWTEHERGCALAQAAS